MKQHIRMEIKEISAEGSFEGVLSPYNNVDLENDLVEPGAFTKTINEHGPDVPLLWQHDQKNPIGKLTLEDTQDALNVRGQLLMDLPEAQKAYLLIKAGIVKGLSIGYVAVKKAMEGPVRRLKELRLYEGSIVTIPANGLAMITSVKARQEANIAFSSEFAEAQLQDAAYQMWISLKSALTSIPWTPELTREEKIEASKAAIGKMADAYGEFIPTYLDWLTEEYGSLETMSREPVEIKRGAAISYATNQKIRSAREHMKNADQVLCALTEDEAVDDTSDSKAAPKPEPDLHSASQLLDDFRALYPAAA